MSFAYKAEEKERLIARVTMGWAERDIPDQSGRTAVVTGANSGLGEATAGALAAAGAEVVMACRDRARGEAALDRVRRRSGSEACVLVRCDLADLESVRECAAALDARGGVDLLILNAGIMGVPRRRTEQGFELQLGTNHLGHFALTGQLLGALLERPEPRVVTISSFMHWPGRISFGNLDGSRRYWRWLAYSQSKLANLLFAYELERRARAASTRLTSMAAHPGYAATELQFAGARMDGNPVARAGWALANRLFAQSAEMGALPALYAATAPALKGGSYVGPGGLLELRGHPRRTVSSPLSRSRDAAQRLWRVSEDLTGVRFAFERPDPAGSAGAQGSDLAS